MHMQTFQRAAHSFRQHIASQEKISLEDAPAVSAMRSYRNDSSDGWLIVSPEAVPLCNALDSGELELLV